MESDKMLTQGMNKGNELEEERRSSPICHRLSDLLQMLTHLVLPCGVKT